MSQPCESAAAYLRTKVLSARPEELRMMLLDGAHRFACQGRDALVRRDFEGSFNAFSRCRSIILELINSLRPEIDPDLCQRVSGLYTFIYMQLVEAGHERSVPKAEKAAELLDYERETWRLLMEKLAADHTAETAARAALAPAGETELTVSA